MSEWLSLTQKLHTFRLAWDLKSSEETAFFARWRVMSSKSVHFGRTANLSRKGSVWTVFWGRAESQQNSFNFSRDFKAILGLRHFFGSWEIRRRQHTNRILTSLHQFIIWNFSEQYPIGINETNYNVIYIKKNTAQGKYDTRKHTYNFIHWWNPLRTTIEEASQTAQQECCLPPRLRT